MREILDEITSKNGFEYYFDGEELVVNRNSEQNKGRKNASNQDGNNADDENNDDEDNDGETLMRVFPLKFLSVKEVKEKLTPLLSDRDRVVYDEAANSFILYGIKTTLDKVRLYIDSFDRMPLQILIEAQIVEITKNKSLELGVSFGDLTNTGLENIKDATGSAVSRSTMSPTNLSLGLKWGVIDGRSLQMRLAAAEASGHAKIISRPNVLTLNNVSAVIKSGITFHVKTLTAQSSQPSSGGGSTGGGSGDTAGIAGGLQKITAGLVLQVLPTTIGKDFVKLNITVANSEPEESSSIDGIPGIIDNSAQTTIIIKDNQTATLAGLIKNDFGQTKNGTPFLSDIPFLGWLFKNQLQRTRNTELMIFITPHLITQALEDEKINVGVRKMSEFANKKKEDDKDGSGSK
ncbi:MAG: hypothetical protein HQK50_18840 [Oligoflexia bacterium]|nr:hypothetical protein [Oligoflexia bacterium]